MDGVLDYNPWWVDDYSNLNGILTIWKYGDISKYNWYWLVDGMLDWIPFGKLTWLVIWNISIMFPYIGNFIIPTDELHHFSEGWLNHQPVT